jgi:hypothetical protein
MNEQQAHKIGSAGRQQRNDKDLISSQTATITMKPSIALLILAVLFAPSLALAKVEGEVAPSSPMLRGTTPEESAVEEQSIDRDLQDSLMCYKAGADGKMRPASCGSVGVCESYACCSSMASCFGQGQKWCGGTDSYASGFAIEYVNEATCPYQWSCCY